MIVRASILCALLLASACSHDKVSKQFSISDFKSGLRPDMGYNDFTGKFGPPLRDIGSGIHIYVYPLDDSTQIIIGFADRILYARHTDSSGNVIETLIGS